VFEVVSFESDEESGSVCLCVCVEERKGCRWWSDESGVMR